MGLVEIKPRVCSGMLKNMQNVEMLLQLLTDSEELSKAQDSLSAMVGGVVERYAAPQEKQPVSDDELDDEALEQLFAAGSKIHLQTRKR